MLPVILDPEDFPFSETDLLHAFEQTCSLGEARFRTQAVVEGIKEQLASEQVAAAARARGSSNPREVNSITVAFPWPVLLILTSASPELRERVDALRRKWRTQRHKAALMEEALRISGWTGQHEVPPQAHEAVAARYEAEDRQWSEAVAQFQSSTQEHAQGLGPPARRR
jgi:hypothetical protein